MPADFQHDPHKKKGAGKRMIPLPCPLVS